MNHSPQRPLDARSFHGLPGAGDRRACGGLFRRHLRYFAESVATPGGYAGRGVGAMALRRATGAGRLPGAGGPEGRRRDHREIPAGRACQRSVAHARTGRRCRAKRRATARANRSKLREIVTVEADVGNLVGEDRCRAAGSRAARRRRTDAPEHGPGQPAAGSQRSENSGGRSCRGASSSRPTPKLTSSPVT